MMCDSIQTRIIQKYTCELRSVRGAVAHPKFGDFCSNPVGIPGAPSWSKSICPPNNFLSYTPLVLTKPIFQACII